VAWYGNLTQSGTPVKTQKRYIGYAGGDYHVRQFGAPGKGRLSNACYRERKRNTGKISILNKSSSTDGSDRNAVDRIGDRKRRVFARETGHSNAGIVSRMSEDRRWRFTID